MNQIHNLAKIDLNLLVAFDMLAREQSVTRAAIALGVTQSAMSHTLNRLRALLEDPLLIRGGRGMRLTPRAQALVVPLRASLESLGRALSTPPTFDPATATRAFRIAGPDLFSELVLPGLLLHFRENAPGVGLSIIGTGHDELIDDLETGQVDFCVQAVPNDGPAVPSLPTTGLTRRTLFRDEFACFVRHDHPCMRAEPLTIERFAQMTHVLVSPTGRGSGPVDGALAARGLCRRVGLRVPHFSTALTAIQHSDLILTAPRALARVVHDRVAMFRPPLPLAGHGIALAWHERWTADPAHRWLRQLVADQAVAIQREPALLQGNGA